jgi:6-pyruvoyltetrahydropterin/6-carboxytetrahydropterin synthase
MPTTTLKRFEFSAAHQLHGSGPESRLHGHNYILWVGASAAVQPSTGMVINVVELKALVNQTLDAYDHRHLNIQLGETEPTLPNIAHALWRDLQNSLPAPVELASIELLEEGGQAVFLTKAETTLIVSGEFSAAHRTHAPRLSTAENVALYGKCDNPAGHGHNYKAELYLPPDTRLAETLWAEFDHKNLSADIPDLAGRNVVTEALAELLARRVPPARRVRVWETPTFFAEYHRSGTPYRLGRRYRFNAAHRLNSRDLSAEENLRLYGKCNRPEPHGHTYFVEVTLAGELDPRTEAAYDLGQLDRIAAEILGEVDYAYLDRDVAAFRNQPSTGENIANYLWSGFETKLGESLKAVRVGETPNNQFLVTKSF